VRVVVLSLVVVSVVVFGAPLASAAPALTPSQIGKCLDLTGRSALRTAHVLDGLSLDPAVVKEVRSRLSQYYSVRGFPGLDGAGLSPEQAAEIMRRVKAEVAATSRPVGSPCAPFKNRAKVIQRIRALLVYNGFRPAMKFAQASPRQIRVQAIQDGTVTLGVIVKVAPRKLFLSIGPMTGGGSDSSLTVPVTFDA
jgi:hypothetical protein